jgi:hypothetical protein
MKKTGEARRLPPAAAMVRTLRVSARDEVTGMFCKRTAIIHRKGRERLEELREAHRAESERLLEVFGDVLAAARGATAAEAGSEEVPAAGPGTAGEADDEQAARRAGACAGDGSRMGCQIQPRERASWTASWRLAAPSLAAAEER